MGGESGCRMMLSMYFLVVVRLEGTLLVVAMTLEEEDGVEEAGERGGPRKVNGDASRPMRKASEKLSVASVARNMPSRRREIHCVRITCWWLRGAWREIRAARRVGRRMFDKVNIWRVRESIYEGKVDRSVTFSSIRSCQYEQDLRSAWCC